MVIVDEARGVGLGLGKEREKWEPDEAFSVDTLTHGGSRFLCCYTSLPIFVTHQNTHGDVYRSARPVCLPLHFVLFILFNYCTPVSSLPPPIPF